MAEVADLRAEIRSRLMELQVRERSLKDRLSNYDHAAEKAYSVGAFKMLKNAEASLGRWLVELLHGD